MYLVDYMRFIVNADLCIIDFQELDILLACKTLEMKHYNKI